MASDVDPLAVTWSDDEVAVVHGLHGWVAASGELNHHLTTWMGLSTSDAAALGYIVWALDAGSPISPAALSRRIGLTSGATTVLLNRLEEGRHITRTREHVDRRRVTLRPTPDSHSRVRAFVAFAGTEIASCLQDTPPADLRTALVFLERITGACQQANQRLGHEPIDRH